jgi:hypothetical protein
MIIKSPHGSTSRVYGITLVRGWILATIFTVFTTAVIAETESNQEMLGPDKWPITVDGAVQDLLLRLPSFEKSRIKQTKKEDTISLYLDLGTQVRNRYGLWRGNDKLIFSACGFPCHPDDAAMKIIEAVWQKLQE